MQNKLLKILPWLALASLTVVLFSLLAGSEKRQEQLTESPETRRAAEAALAKIMEMRPQSADDPALRAALDEILSQPPVASVWLFAPDGRLLYAAGSTAQRQFIGTVEEQATDEMHRVLAALPEEALTSELRLRLLAASAIQAEGDHNDIYRHMLRDIRRPDGSLAALVGLAYDVSPWVSSMDAGWIMTVILFMVCLAIYWLSLPLWVLLDARRRSEKAWIWTIFVLAGNLVALIAYLLVRKEA